MDEYDPWILPELPDFSKQTTREVCDLILSFSSVASPRTPAAARTAQVLFPDEPFVYPTRLWDFLWDWANRIIDQIGLWVEQGLPNDGRWGLCDSDWHCLQNYPLAIRGACMWELWPAAVRVYFVLRGPESFAPTVYTLRELEPFCRPSARMARYVRDTTGIDTTAGFLVIDRLIESRTMEPAAAFPRIRLFGG
jgi:hypothetical protein